jgi:hypothetical protein
LYPRRDSNAQHQRPQRWASTNWATRACLSTIELSTAQLIEEWRAKNNSWRHGKAARSARCWRGGSGGDDSSLQRLPLPGKQQQVTPSLAQHGPVAAERVPHRASCDDPHDSLLSSCANDPTIHVTHHRRQCVRGIPRQIRDGNRTLIENARSTGTVRYRFDTMPISRPISGLTDSARGTGSATGAVDRRCRHLPRPRSTVTSSKASRWKVTA